MCYACICDPFDFIDRMLRAAKQARKTKQEARLLEATELKSAMKAIESSQKRVGDPCGPGKDVVERIKQRQYELARET